MFTSVALKRAYYEFNEFPVRSSLFMWQNNSFKTAHCTLPRIYRIPLSKHVLCQQVWSSKAEPLYLKVEIMTKIIFCNFIFYFKFKKMFSHPKCWDALVSEHLGANLKYYFLYCFFFLYFDPTYCWKFKKINSLVIKLKCYCYGEIFVNVIKSI